MTARDIAAIETAIGDPRQGLPEDVFLLVSRITPLVNVDLLIQDDGGRTLLTWRQDRFFPAGWHLPGGVLRYKETAADRVRACARQELAAEVSFDPTPLCVVETILEARDRGHAVSLLFRCRLTSPLDPAGEAIAATPVAGQWRWHQGAPPDLLAVQSQYARFF
jgi:colanic acid biosynthesis protein WcaH